MNHFRWRFFATYICVFFLSTPAFANAFGDLNCDASINVTDVQLSIIVALGIPISDVLDADQDGTPDACPAEVICGTGTVLEGGACLPLFTQMDVEAAAAAAFDDGVASVDITADNQAAFEDLFSAGVTSVDITSDYQAAFEDGVASVDITSNDQEVYAGANAAGADSVHITTYNQSAFDYGVASLGLTNTTIAA